MKLLHLLLEDESVLMAASDEELVRMGGRSGDVSKRRLRIREREKG